MFEGEVLQRCNTHVKIADKFTGEIKKNRQDWKKFNKKSDFLVDEETERNDRKTTKSA
jgi:hypothetical protein